jgi:hypothetical protein
MSTDTHPTLWNEDANFYSTIPTASNTSTLLISGTGLITNGLPASDPALAKPIDCSGVALAFTIDEMD